MYCCYHNIYLCFRYILIQCINKNEKTMKIYVYVIFYQMGRLFGGTHEISGIKAPIFLRGWVWGVGDGAAAW